jgi:predicted Rossmann-fold nucleotide-binding protein
LRVPRDSAFVHSDPWRAPDPVGVRRRLRRVVTARACCVGVRVGPCRPDHASYKLARLVGARLAAAGLAVITGGGPGVMEAAKRGCKEAGGFSVGCNIELPHEQTPIATSI